jgi:hypothetical protein
MTGPTGDPRSENLPAWQRRTAAESRLGATLAVLVMVGVQWLLPHRFLIQPRWLLPTVELAMLGTLVVANPVRMDRAGTWVRGCAITLTGLLALATAWSAYRLVAALVNGGPNVTSAMLLAYGGAIWLTNVVTFSLIYWEFDRGGPTARAHARKVRPDFLFPQMQSMDLGGPDWEPRYLDYLYLSFTDATAFSPTDVMPLSRWSKALMMTEAALSFVTVALVIARAVNILK